MGGALFICQLPMYMLHFFSLSSPAAIPTLFPGREDLEALPSMSWTVHFHSTSYCIVQGHLPKCPDDSDWTDGTVARYSIIPLCP